MSASGTSVFQNSTTSKSNHTNKLDAVTQKSVDQILSSFSTNKTDTPDKILKNDKFITQPPSTICETESPQETDLISILNYNPQNRQSFTEPATIESLAILGIKEKELFLPTQNEMAKFPKDPDVRSAILEHHTTRISRLKQKIQNKRKEILKSASTSQKSSKTSAHEEFIQNEQHRIEKLKECHVREIESILIRGFENEEKQRMRQEKLDKEEERLRQLEIEREKYQEECHKKHLENLRQANEHEQRRKEQEEKKRQELFEKNQREEEHQKQNQIEKLRQKKLYEQQKNEKNEKNKQKLLLIEKQRQEKIQMKQDIIQAKEESRQMQKMLEKQEKDKANMEKKQRREQILENVQKKNMEIMEIKKIEGENKERKRSQSAANYKSHLKEKQNEFKMKEEMKKTDNQNRRNCLEKELFERRLFDVQKKDEEANLRLMKMQEEREKNSELARMSRTQESLRTQNILEENRQKQLIKQQKMEQDLFMRNEQFKKKQKEQEKQRTLKVIQQQLKHDELMQNVRHREAQRQLKLQKMAERHEEIENRLMNEKKEKEQLRQLKRNVVSQFSEEKTLLEEQMKMNYSQFRNSYDLKQSSTTTKLLAEKYKIDVEDLRLRARMNMSRSRSRFSKTASPSVCGDLTPLPRIGAKSLPSSPVFQSPSNSNLISPRNDDKLPLMT